MSTASFAFFSLAIGFVAGLRAVTALMVVSWAACFNWLDVRHTWAAFLGHTVTAVVITLLAVGELVADQRPTTPSRTEPASFAFRIFCGAFSGAALAAGANMSAVLGIVCGCVGAIAGTLGGHRARTGLVRSLQVRDRTIALPEDLIAVGGGFLLVSLFH